MLGDVISKLKGSVGPELMEKFGLSEDQANKSVEVAGESVTEVSGKQMAFGKSGLLDSLFSDKDNGDDENAVQDEIGGGMVEKLAAKVGVSPEMATKIKDSVLPMIMSAVSSKMGDGGIASLFGGGDDDKKEGDKDGGIVDSITDKLGGFFS